MKLKAFAAAVTLAGLAVGSVLAAQGTHDSRIALMKKNGAAAGVLVSMAKGDPGYVRRVKFYYPLDLVEQANGTFRAKATLAQRASDATVARGPRLAADRLSFGYEIVGGQGLAWRPVRVFDDGEHVYIQMPTALQASEAPALLVQSRGESALVNYRVRLPYYVVDRLFDTAVLIVGVGRYQDRVTIQRKADGQ